MTQLDDHGARILAFVARYRQTYNCSPTYQEIGVAVGIPSTDHVSRDLRRLKRQGYLEYTPRSARSIMLVGAKPDCHLEGTDAPLHLCPSTPVPQNSEYPPLDWVTFGRTLIGDDRDLYVMGLSGEALYDSPAPDRDVVLLKHTTKAKEGELVAVLDKSTRKIHLCYYRAADGCSHLQSYNSPDQVVKIRPTDAEIQGSVLAIVRKEI